MDNFLSQESALQKGCCRNLFGKREIPFLMCFGPDKNSGKESGTAKNRAEEVCS